MERVTAGGCPAVWLTPSPRGTSSSGRRRRRRTVMWLHGGAFILCNTATHARLLSSVGASADARVLSVEYPLGPDQGNYNDMLREVLAAYTWLVDPAAGVVPSRACLI